MTFLLTVYTYIYTHTYTQTGVSIISCILVSSRVISLARKLFLVCVAGRK